MKWFMILYEFDDSSTKWNLAQREHTQLAMLPKPAKSKEKASVWLSIHNVNN